MARLILVAGFFLFGCAQAGNSDKGDSCEAKSECPATSQCEESTCSAGRCVTSPKAQGVMCTDGICSGTGQCVAASCINGTLDGDESDVDCGGTCMPCAPGLSCAGDSDCVSGLCQNNSCSSPGCGDGIVQPPETCDDGNTTNEDGCPDGVGGTCQPSSCGDGFVDAGHEDCDDGMESSACNADCTFAVCGDGKTNASAGETCDDGNNSDADDCLDGASGLCTTATCTDGYFNQNGVNAETSVDCGGACPGSCSPPELLLSEIVTTPTGAEFIEIANIGNTAASLAGLYLSDWNGYYTMANGQTPPNDSDFVVSFPAGASVPASGKVTISLESASAFQQAYSTTPDFDFDSTDAGAPAMSGSFSGNSGLTNNGEMVVLFRWNGSADSVEDVDYLVYGSANQGMDKSGLLVGSHTYAAETSTSQQSLAPAPNATTSASRCSNSEPGESQTGGNGVGGSDETSENLSLSWQLTPPTPGAGNICP